MVTSLYVNGLIVTLAKIKAAVQKELPGLKTARESGMIQTSDQLKTEFDYETWKYQVIKSIEEIDPHQGEMILQSFKELEKDYDNIYFSTIMKSLEEIKAKLIKEEEKANNKKVFIVHGHDELYLSLTESFIRKLGLEPIILRDQVSQSQTIVEKLENNTDVAFAIVLYTGCDRGSINDSKAPLNPRARQNVIYEHGFLNAKLGRKKVCALVQEGVEVPSDLAGVVYTKIDKDGAWKIALAKEMQAAGLNFELNHLIE